MHCALPRQSIDRLVLPPRVPINPKYVLLVRGRTRVNIGSKIQLQNRCCLLLHGEIGRHAVSSNPIR
eukprot:scaffold3108_cov102-Skeletonema_dohrnii-CCMP3373.AAC.2